MVSPRDGELGPRASSGGLNWVVLNAQRLFCASFSHLPNENNGCSPRCKLLRNVGLSLG